MFLQFKCFLKTTFTNWLFWIFQKNVLFHFLFSVLKNKNKKTPMQFKFFFHYIYLNHYLIVSIFKYYIPAVYICYNNRGMITTRCWSLNLIIIIKIVGTSMYICRYWLEHVQNRQFTSVYRVNGANEKSSVVARDFRPRDDLSPTNIRAHIRTDDSPKSIDRAAVYRIIFLILILFSLAFCITIIAQQS